MPLPRFEPVISLGSVILTLVTGACFPFLTYLVRTNAQHDVRITVLEQVVKDVAERSVTSDARTREAINELKLSTNRISDRLTDLAVATAARNGAHAGAQAGVRQTDGEQN